MRTLRTIAMIGIVAFFAKCKEKATHVVEDEKVIQLDTELNNPNVKPHANSYAGKWNYGFPFYSSELYINHDGTFKFHEQSCTGHGYSKGKWTADGAKIVLSSLKRYLNNEAPKLTEAKSNPGPAIPKRKIKKGATNFYLDPLLFNITVNYKFGPGDTNNIYFDNVHLKK